MYATPDAYKQFIPEGLRDRPLRDGQVVEALENWAAGEAQGHHRGLFLVAAGLMVIAVPPALALGGRPARAPVPARGDRGGLLPRRFRPGGGSMLTSQKSTLAL